jgi:membrane protease YdiL (CAAX protease family)
MNRKNLLLAGAAPLLVGMVFMGTHSVPAAVLLYHALCAAAVYRRRSRIRDLLWRRGGLLGWTIGTSLLIVPFLFAAPWIQDPAPYRDLFRDTVLPSGPVSRVFPGVAIYTMIVHVPLEELFWRGAVLDPERPCQLGNGIFFYLLHAIPMTMILGPKKGLLFALPTLAAGTIWAFVTIRSRSLWPGLVSHWGADGVILAGMWFYFIR